jgi:ketosteroid isomerase-like protein
MTLPEEIFLQFCENYKSRDLQAMLNLFSQNMTAWGSGVDEYRVGIKQMEAQLLRDWNQSEKCEIEIVSFIPAPSNATWAAAICNARITIGGKEHVFEQLRGTIIIEKENDAWKILHMHASFPDYRNPENGSFPVN